MHIHISENYISLSSENEAEKHQMHDLQTQVERYKIAAHPYNRESIIIYTKSRAQYDDETKDRRG